MTATERRPSGIGALWRAFNDERFDHNDRMQAMARALEADSAGVPLDHDTKEKLKEVRVSVTPPERNGFIPPDEVKTI